MSRLARRGDITSRHKKFAISSQVAYRLWPASEDRSVSGTQQREDSRESPAIASNDVDRVDLPRWTAPVFLLFSVALVPWIVWLGVSLPSRHEDQIYDVTWVGFDIGLLIALAAVMWLAYKRSTYVEIAATIAGTMLVVDAWFDTTTSIAGWDRWQAIGAAVFIELPIAALCWWLSQNAEKVRRRRTASLLGPVSSPRSTAQESTRRR